MLDTDAGPVALQEAARAVGPPRLRTAATLGGNLATCSPAGDTLPVLAALAATVVLRSAAGERRGRFDDYMTRPKKSGPRPDGLVFAAALGRPRAAPPVMKGGKRNAKVISVP